MAIAYYGVQELAMGVLSVRHLTTYRYAEPVELGEHRMMFRPRESHDLRLIRTHLHITPRPIDLHWRHDVFDNSVAVANFDCATTCLQFDSMITLEHVETRLPDYALELAARSFPFEYPRDEWPDLAPALQRPDPSEEVDQWAARFAPPRSMSSGFAPSGFMPSGFAPSGFVPERPSGTGAYGTLDLLRAMALGIRQQLRYIRRVERGVQTPVQTLRQGSGTCRDFAWLMIDAVRSLGFAARFVSGYIFVPDATPSSTAAPPSTATPSPTATPSSTAAPISVGDGGATHAWLQVYLPGAGWVDFDPTNSIIGNRNLIRVAVAWSPMQVLPLWGTYVGSASACLGMQVAVSVTEEPTAGNTVS
jgi:transglutaminase-like putative cysteine protease